MPLPPMPIERNSLLYFGAWAKPVVTIHDKTEAEKTS